VRLAEAREHWLAERRFTPASALVVHRAAPEGRALALRLALSGCRVAEAPPNLVGPALRRLRREPPPRALVLIGPRLDPRRGGNPWPLWREANIARPLRAAAAAELALRRAGACQILPMAEALPGGGAREARLAEGALLALLDMVSESLGPLARVNALVRGAGERAAAPRVAAAAAGVAGVGQGRA